MLRSYSLRRWVPTAICTVAGSLLLIYGFVRYSRYSPRLRPDLRTPLRHRLAQAFPYEACNDLPHHIWQTWKHSPSQEEFEPAYRGAWESWSSLNPEHVHEVFTDSAASQLVAKLFVGVEEAWQAYEALPRAILKADFFRYLILLAQGGVYSDIDTTNLKPIKDWVPTDMHPYGLVAGIEADPDRPDWNDWYARRVQFCQWTIASSPGHPILVDVVARITLETLARKAQSRLNDEDLQDVMEITGPGIWTDAVFAYFNNPDYANVGAPLGEDNVTWQYFANLKERRKSLDVVVLPITSFSPDVGHMGSGTSSDPIAFVSHGFSGSWKSGH